MSHPFYQRRVISSAAVAALVAAGAIVASQANADDAKASVSIGAPAPTFELKDQEGKTVSLADYKDKVVVLEWFNDGCPFVKKFYSAGDMNKLAADYEAKGVVWIAVNSTKSAGQDHNKVIAAKWNVLRPILDDAEGKVGKLYGAKTTPQMYVINKGTLVYNGAIDSKDTPDQTDIASSDNYVKAALDEVLEGKPVSRSVTPSYGCSVKYAK